MIKIDPNFWKDVENPDCIKHVIYGDSITENEKVLVALKSQNYKLDLISFKELWDTLSNEIKRIKHNNKEYLYINDQLKVVTYIDTTKTFLLVTPLYLVRHFINKSICKLNFKKYPSIQVTRDHSLLTYKHNKLVPIKPINANHIVGINKKTKAVLIPIQSKDDLFYSGYVYDFSVPTTENFVVNGFIVHNTDSIYIHVPNETYKTADEALIKADTLANEINGIITNVLNSHLLVKMNVDRAYNKTFFKTESVISKMMLLASKKNYTYVELGKKGKVNKEPKIKYTGIPIVRSDYSKFAQDFIKYLIEEVVFSDLEFNNENISNKISEIIEGKQSELYKYLDDYNFRHIATPGRWSLSNKYKSEPFVVIGMRLYNTTVDQEIFRPGINGLSVPITIVNDFKFKEEISKNANRSNMFIGNTPINKLNYIVLPTNYEVDIIKQIFINYSIRPNKEVIWNKSFGTVAKNIVKVIMSHYQKN